MLGRDAQRLAFKAALARALADVRAEHPEVADQLLDEVFLLTVTPWLDRDGVRRVRSALPDLAPSYRQHEVAARLARRTLALGDDRLDLPGDLYGVKEAVAAIADALPAHLIEPAAEIAGTDRDALGALARRAAVLGDGDAAPALVDRAARHEHPELLAQLAPIVPDATVPALLERAREAGYGASRALVALVARVPEALSEAVDACAELRVAMAETRVRLLHELAPELARLPAPRLAGLYSEAVRRSAELGREEVLADVEAFAPALVRRFGPALARELDDAIRLAGGDRWP